MTLRIFLTIFSIIALFTFSCKKDSTSISNPIDYTQIKDISYSEHVQPLLNQYCTSCHGSQNPEAGLQVDIWDNLIKGSRDGEALIPFDPDNSLMVEMLTKLSTASHPSETGQAAPDSIEIAFLARWVREGAKNDAGNVPYENSAHRLYVCNQDAGIISVIDTDAKVVIRNIKLAEVGYSSNPKPHDLAVAPDGENWYVSLIGDNKVVKFDKNYQVVADVDFPAAGLLAMHPTKDLLYVGHTLSISTVPQTIGVITRSTMSLTEISLPFPRPHAMVADHSGQNIFFASLVQSVLATVDTDVNPSEVANLFSISGPSRTLVQMNISPDDQDIYISSQLEEQLLVFDSSDPTNITLIDSVDVGQHPWHPKFTPDGSRVYVGNNVSHTVSAVNTTTRQELQQIGMGDGSDGLAEPHGLVVSLDGSYVYVTNRNKNIPAEYTPRYDFSDNANAGTVVVINTITNQIEKVIEIEQFPSGLAIYEE
jgi:YVTN family beta-propeller protein